MPRLRRGLIAGAIVVLGAGLAAWLLTNGEAASSPLQKKDRGLIKEVTPAAAPTYKEEPKKEVDPKKARIAKLREMAKHMTPDQKWDLIEKERLSRPLNLTPTTNHPFRTSIEVQMARIFMTEPGNAPPPLLPISDYEEAHLAEILIADNPVLDGDGAEVQEGKSVVEQVKKELKGYIKEGGNAKDFLKYYHGKLVEAYQERQECSRQVLQVIHDDPSIGKEFYEKVNKRLEKKGIKQIKLPKKAKELIGME